MHKDTDELHLDHDERDPPGRPTPASATAARAAHAAKAATPSLAARSGRADQVCVNRVARFGAGHHQRVSLSPLSAIGDMVAPVVLITLATIFSNGLMATGTTMASRTAALNQERMGILRGPHGEILDENAVPPMDRERLTQIGKEMPLLYRRALRIRTAVLIIWIAIGLLILSVAAIAVAATAHSEPFAFTALALVMAGVTGVFAGAATVIIGLATTTEPLAEETRRRVSEP